MISCQEQGTKKWEIVTSLQDTLNLSFCFNKYTTILIYSIENAKTHSKIRAKKPNISSESPELHQRCEVSGCVRTEKLLRIPKSGL